MFGYEHQSCHDELRFLPLHLNAMFDMIDGLILVMSRLQAVVLRVWDFGGVTDWYQSHWL